MGAFVPIEGRQGLVRDMTSGAILNVNPTDYTNFQQKQMKAREQRELLRTQQDEINMLKSELGEMKQLLQQLVKNQNG